FVARRALPVYSRQLFPERLLGEASEGFETAGTTISETDALRVWTLDAVEGEDRVLIASIKNKMHAISPAVMEGLMEALELAEAEYAAMVIWPGAAPFSVGADLQATMPAFVVGGADAVESIEQELQQLMLRLRYAQVPVVAGIHGMALGGGCELAVHCARRVA